MRRLFAEPRSVASSADLTPMLDVVFIMLIFFVVTATFVHERGIDVDPPAPDRAETLRPDDSPIVVRIDDDDRIRVASRELDIRNVGANLLRLRTETPTAAVVVVPTAGSTTGALIGVMDAARQVGIDDLKIGAIE